MTTDNTDVLRKPRGRPLALLTPAQVAAHHGVSDRAVRFAIEEGRLRAQKVNQGWVIKQSDCERWQPNLNKGPRRKGKTNG